MVMSHLADVRCRIKSGYCDVYVFFRYKHLTSRHGMALPHLPDMVRHGMMISGPVSGLPDIQTRVGLACQAVTVFTDIMFVYGPPKLKRMASIFMKLRPDKTWLTRYPF